jgi:putative ABC transport system permease protein
MALGAESGTVKGMVLWQGMLLTGGGLLLGLAASFGLTRLMEALLYGVDPVDPLTFGGVTLCLALVALLACYVPAHRAAKVDPVVAIRLE